MKDNRLLTYNGLSSSQLFTMKIPRWTMLFLSIINVLIRILGDVIANIINFDKAVVIVPWNILTYFAILIPFTIFVFSKYYDDNHINDDIESNAFFSDSKFIMFFTLIIIIIQFFLPARVSLGMQAQNIIQVIIIDIINILTYSLGIYLSHFLYKWLNIRKHKLTIDRLKTISVAAIFVFFVEIINRYFVTSDIYHDFLNYFIGLVLFSLFVLVLLTAKKNFWIAVLSVKRKLLLLFISSLILVSLTILNYMVYTDNILYKSLDQFLRGSWILPSMASLYLIAYFLRIFFSTLLSLPTTSIVERRTSELISLTNLNKMVAQNTDYRTILESINHLALNACKASYSWVELYREDEVEIFSSTMIDEAFIKEFHKENGYLDYISSHENITLYGSLKNNVSLRYIPKIHKYSNSMILVPLYSNKERIGTLIVVHHDEYGLDRDDLKVLSAFGDNVNMAIENARLIRESLEKEHYKRELQLAQDIQRKLLPNKLPELDEYDVSAISIPAEEVGGDFYEFGFFKDNSPFALVADVSGKGMNAAFYMAQLKGVILAKKAYLENNVQLLKQINSTLFDAMEKQMFITMTSISLHPEKNKLKMARAGHMPTIVKNDGEVKLYSPPGLGIGLARENIFSKTIKEIEIDLEPGGICIVYTDGINELRNEKDEEFGTEFLVKIIEENEFSTANEINERILEELRKFSGGKNQHDDMTLVSILRK